MTEVAPTKLLLTRVRSFLSQSLTTETPSDVETTSWLCAMHGTGRTPLARNSFQPTQTSDTSPRKSGTLLKLLLKKHGTALSKSTHLSASRPSSPNSPLAGPTTATQVHRVLTIAQSVQTYVSVALSLMPTTRLAFTLVLQFLAQTPKLCLDNGSTKLAQFTALPSVINSGFLVTCSAVLLKTTVSTYLSLQNCSQNGMVQAATPIFQLRQ